MTFCGDADAEADADPFESDEATAGGALAVAALEEGRSTLLFAIMVFSLCCVLSQRGTNSEAGDSDASLASACNI